MSVGPTRSPLRSRTGLAGQEPWSSRGYRSGSLGTGLEALELFAHLEHPRHPQQPVELAREVQRPRGGEGDVQLHLALGRDVLVDAERGNGDVVQGTYLVLDDQCQLLTGV